MHTVDGALGRFHCGHERTRCQPGQPVLTPGASASPGTPAAPEGYRRQSWCALAALEPLAAPVSLTRLSPLPRCHPRELPDQRSGSSSHETAGAGAESS